MSTNPSRVHALVVGLSEYAESSWKVQQAGPAFDAIEFAKWLVSRDVPVENIQLFTSPPLESDYFKSKYARATEIMTFLTDGYAEQDGELFLLFWAGHGFIDAQRRRRLLLPEATARNWFNVDLESVLRFLASSLFPVRRQACFIDACANYVSESEARPADPGSWSVPNGEPVDTDQFVIWAKTGTTGRAAKTGRLSSALREHLRVPSTSRSDDWLPDLDAVSRAVIRDLRGVQEPTTVRFKSWSGAEQAFENRSTIPNQDWGNAPDSQPLFGRKKEVEELYQITFVDRCRAVAIAGIGGVGKTQLSMKLRSFIESQNEHKRDNDGVAARFDRVLWRSLRTRPLPYSFLESLITSLSGGQVRKLPTTTEQRLDLLLTLLRQHRCLLILDNFESVMGIDSRTYQPGCDAYGQLLQLVADVPHRSCIVLTSREIPTEIMEAATPSGTVRKLQIKGIDVDSAKDFCNAELQGNRVRGSNEDWKAVCKHYDGNPLALKLMCRHVVEQYSGNLKPFVGKGIGSLGRLNALLRWHIDRLGRREMEFVSWLAISQEPIELHKLYESLSTESSRDAFESTLENVNAKLPIERHHARSDSITLQPVLLDFLSETIVKTACGELESGKTSVLESHALLQANAPGYIRSAQERTLLWPLIEHFGSQESVIKLLNSCLQAIRGTPNNGTSYFAGNAINLFTLMNVSLDEMDFSKMDICEARLDSASMAGTNLMGAYVTRSVFRHDFSHVCCLAFNPIDQNILAAGDASGGVTLWSVPSGQQLKTYDGHKNYVMSLAFSPNDGSELVSGSYDGTIRLWKENHDRVIFSDSGRWFICIRYSPDGSYLAAGDNFGGVWVFDKDYQIVESFELGDCAQIWSVAFSPDSSELLIGDENGQVTIWDWRNSVQRLAGIHDDAVRAVTYLPKGNEFATASYDGVVRTWDSQSLRCLREFRCDSGVWSLANGPEESQITVGTTNGPLEIWEFNEGNHVRSLPGHANWVVEVAVDNQRQVIASAGNDGTVRFWDSRSYECLNSVRGYNNAAFCLTCSGDNQVAAGYEDGAIRLWELGEEVAPVCLQGHSFWVLALDYNPQNRLLASAGYEDNLNLWNLESKKIVGTLAGHTNWIASLSFSPSGNLLVSGSYDRTIRVWDVNSHECLAILEGHAAWVWAAKFCNEQILLSGGDDADVIKWSFTESRIVGRFKGHKSRIRSIGVSPDGKLCASASYDNTARIWDIQSGECLQTLSGHEDWVMSASFGNDGKWLLTASYDGTARIWETATGRCKHTFRSNSNRIESAIFANSKQLLLGGENGCVELWDIDSEEKCCAMREPRPYENLLLVGTKGITEAQLRSLRTLGAIC